MPNRILVLALAALTAACQAGSTDVSAASQGAPSSSAIQLTLHLVELSENPTPVGLPATLLVTAPKLPRAGERVVITWSALDGSAPPREGSGSIEVESQGGPMLIELTAAGRAPTEVLMLSGTNSAGAVRGTFSDRLFFRRAGRFEGQISER